MDPQIEMTLTHQFHPRSGVRIQEFLIFSVYMRLLYVILFCLLVGVVVPMLISLYVYEFTPAEHYVSGTCHIKEGVRTDCFPDVDDDDVTEEMCEARGCCYQVGKRCTLFSILNEPISSAL